MRVVACEDLLRPAFLENGGAVRAVPVLRPDRLFDRADRHRRARGEAPRDLFHLGLESLVRHDTRHDADALGLAPGHILAQEQQVERAAAAEIVHEPHHADAPGRDDAEIDVAGAELRAFGRDPDVRRPGKAGAAADAPAAHGRYHRRAEGLDPLHEEAPELAEGAAVLRRVARLIAKIRARREGAVAGAGHDHAARLGALLELVEGR